MPEKRSNQPAAIGTRSYQSQLIRYIRITTTKAEFLSNFDMLTTTMLKREFTVEELRRVLRTFTKNYKAALYRIGITKIDKLVERPGSLHP